MHLPLTWINIGLYAFFVDRFEEISCWLQYTTMGIGINVRCNFNNISFKDINAIKWWTHDGGKDVKLYRCWLLVLSGKQHCFIATEIKAAKPTKALQIFRANVLNPIGDTSSVQAVVSNIWVSCLSIIKTDIYLYIYMIYNTLWSCDVTATSQVLLYVLKSGHQVPYPCIYLYMYICICVCVTDTFSKIGPSHCFSCRWNRWSLECINNFIPQFTAQVIIHARIEIDKASFYVSFRALSPSDYFVSSVGLFTDRGFIKMWT